MSNEGVTQALAQGASPGGVALIARREPPWSHSISIPRRTATLTASVRVRTPSLV
jgi:hypothetical protein